ncbi:hypothetical protein Bealeia1_00041 [Candidatus Bealeia paramacronuclearis]|uniref:Uncharacterized protein n=1 Tax=Candidatus Bealeia paramacronuclearis TaxID=1921001 RepID=A0ABZ2C0H9_9PROT|nr:hypothetical protein [Candidatus Bealeia paramacronuclearis]
MLKHSLSATVISCFISFATNAEGEDLYDFPSSVYHPPLKSLILPAKDGIPTQLKTGYDPLIKKKKVNFNSLEDITEESVIAFKIDLVEKVLKRTTFEVELLGENNLQHLPPLWVFGSEFQKGEDYTLTAKKIARLAMSATNEYLHNVSETEKKQLISNLYVRAGNFMKLAAESASSPKVKQDQYLSAAQYYYWATKRVDNPYLKADIRKSIKECSLESCKYGKMSSNL